MKELSPKKSPKLDSIEDIIEYATKGMKEFFVFLGSMDEIERGYGKVIILSKNRTVEVRFRRGRIAEIITKKGQRYIKRKYY